MSGVWFALGLTLLAGMATGIGSAIAFTAKRTNYRFLSVATGFSAGVMLYVSFVEIFFKGASALTERYGDVTGYWVNTLAFFGGMAIIFVIDTLIPAGENPHETHAEAETAPLHDPSAPVPDGSVMPGAADRAPGLHDHTADHHKLMRMGLFTALAIGIHNLPEGLATFLAALEDPGLGVAVAIAIAIALHNIPEGISVSVPIFYATGDRKKAFIYSLFSGLSEPVGAAIATSSSSSCSAAQAPTFPRSSWASCSPVWPASWCTSAWTSCSPPAGLTAKGTTVCTGSSRGCW